MSAWQVATFEATLTADVLFLAVPDAAIRELLHKHLSVSADRPVVVSLAADLELSALRSMLSRTLVIRMLCSPAIAGGASFALICCSPNEESRATSLMHALFPKCRLAIVPASEMHRSVVLFSTVGVLAYFFAELSRRIASSGLSPSVASEISRAMPAELQQLCQIAGFDYSAAFELCCTPAGLVDRLTTALRGSDFLPLLRKTLDELLGARS